MTIEVNENLIGTWHIEFDGGNFMAAATELPDEPGTFLFQSRFRYYVDDKTDETSEDVKNWYEGRVSDTTRESVIQRLRHMFSQLAEVMESEVVEILMNDERDIELFVQELTSKPFSNAQHIDAKTGEKAVLNTEHRKRAH